MSDRNGQFSVTAALQFYINILYKDLAVDNLSEFHIDDIELVDMDNRFVVLNIATLLFKLGRSSWACKLAWKVIVASKDVDDIVLFRCCSLFISSFIRCTFEELGFIGCSDRGDGDGRYATIKQTLDGVIITMNSAIANIERCSSSPPSCISEIKSKLALKVLLYQIQVSLFLGESVNLQVKLLEFNTAVSGSILYNTPISSTSDLALTSHWLSHSSETSDALKLIFLRSHIEYALGNYSVACTHLSFNNMSMHLRRAASSNEQSITNYRNSCMKARCFNNLGCSNLKMGLKNVACMYFSKAVDEIQLIISSAQFSSSSTTTNGILIMDNFAEILYNSGLSFLLNDQPVTAFSCFSYALGSFLKRPLLWIRLAECCMLQSNQCNTDANGKEGGLSSSSNGLLKFSCQIQNGSTWRRFMLR